MRAMRFAARLLLPCALAFPASAAAAAVDAPLPHIRALDACAARALAEGRRRSPTFRALVGEIERSDVIVFVYTTPLLSPHVSGGLSFVGASSSWRYLKIALRRDQMRAEMIWVLAHELRHAVEVARAARARTQAAFNALYGHIGKNGALRDTFETEEAYAAGLQVRRELGDATGGG